MAKMKYSDEICIDISADEMTEVTMFRMAHKELKLKQKTDDWREGYTLCGTVDDMMILHANITGITEEGSHSFDSIKNVVKKLKSEIDKTGLM